MTSSADKPEIVLYTACTLDGYIARPDGNLDWLFSIPSTEDHGYTDLIASTSCIIMGRKTYSDLLGLITDWPYTGTPTYVMTSEGSFMPSTPDTYRLSGDLRPAVMELLSRQKKNIWLAGGGKVVSWFLANDLIDRMIISVVPVILGEGIRLFLKETGESSWNMVKAVPYSTGIVNLTYVRKHKIR